MLYIYIYIDSDDKRIYSQSIKLNFIEDKFINFAKSMFAFSQRSLNDMKLKIGTSTPFCH